MDPSHDCHIVGKCDDFSQNYQDGETTQTTVYYYKDGKRASDISGQEYPFCKGEV